jgi:hypothetical protein
MVLLVSFAASVTTAYISFQVEWLSCKSSYLSYISRG